MPRILVCDDNALMIRTIEFCLKSEGYEVITATDGHRADEYLRNRGQSVDLVITDLLLPYMSGLELINLIRLHYYLDMPVIVLTKAFNDALRQQALEMGANEFIAKPVDPRDLSRLVNKLITNR